jgi:hypothetical protein
MARRVMPSLAWLESGLTGPLRSAECHEDHHGECRDGYMRVTLRDGKRTATRRVHELVMPAHAGPRPAGMHILHKDDDQEKNDRQSRRYGTQSENEKEKKGREKGRKEKGKGKKERKEGKRKRV